MLRSAVTVLTWLVAMGVSSAHAITVVPTGLNPGDQYRLAFLTSMTRDAFSLNIADYNAFVTGVANSVAELAALGTTWTAIGSTVTVDARDNTGTNPSSVGVPIYLLNDTKLADNNADLWDGTIDTPLIVEETGTTHPFELIEVWSGSLREGVRHPSNYLGRVEGSRFGFATIDDFRWISASVGSNYANRPMYAMSDVITAAAVPMPGAVWLFGSALGLMGVMQRKIRA